MGVTRRRFLRLAGGAGLIAAGVASCSDSDDRQDPGQPTDSTQPRLLKSQLALPAMFTVPFRAPPVKKAGAGGRYEIVQKLAKVELVPGFSTEVMGYDGVFPGPTIEARSGQGVQVVQRNALGLPTTTHLHGGNTPADSDGYPTDLVQPGGDKVHTYPMTQRAATLWYHDHRMDFTGPQVWKGLAGFLVVRDAVEDALPLPGGDRDVPVMISDRSFKADGSLWYPSVDPTLKTEMGTTEEYMGGVLGDVVLVNGAPWPVMEVDAARYRFRFLNASNARRYGLKLSTGPKDSLVQIGSDGGLLDTPRKHDVIEIAPAERFDVVIDFSAYEIGTEITLLNTLAADSASKIMKFHVVRKAKDDSAVPQKLSEIERLPRSAPKSDDEVDRLWTFGRGEAHGGLGWVINGKAFDPERPDPGPARGTTEVWRFAVDVAHPVHVHLSPFQVLSRNGGPPGAYDLGWKDTVDIAEAQYVDVAVRFENHAGRYLLHCHNLEHEDMGMMAAFEVG